jgi:hypothetical protein
VSFLLMLALPAGAGRRRPAQPGSNETGEITASEGIAVG